MDSSRACSSEEGTKHKGEEQLLDMYLSKRDALSFRGELECEAPVQAYIILRDKQGLWSDVSSRAKPNNTFGIVMAAAQAKSVHEISILPYPLLYANNVILLLAKNVPSPQPFAKLSLSCLTKFVAADSQKLYVCVASGLKFLQSKTSGNRAIVRYVGCACGERQSMVKRNMHPVSSSSDEESDADVESHMHPVSLSSDEESDADVESLKSTLFQKRTILLPRQVLQDFDAPGDNRPMCPETNAWLTDQSGCTSAHEGKPGSLGETPSTLTAGIQVPPRGQTIDRGIQLGASRHCISESA